MKGDRFLLVTCALLLGLVCIPSGATADGTGTDDPGANAFMTVSAWHDDTFLTSWSGRTRWNDVFGVFRARVEGGRLTWQGQAADNARVETDEQGLGGKSLLSWLPRRTNLVVVVVSAYGLGENPAGGTGTRSEREDGKLRAPVALADTLEAADGRSAHRSGSYGAAGSGHSGAGAGDSETDADAEDADTEALVQGLGSGAGAGAGAGHGRGPGEYAGTGTEDGTKGGVADGQRGGITAEQGGVGDAYAARPDGQRSGDPEGGRGGTGSRGDAGARGGLGLLGGFINVPRSIRAAVEVALILEEGNLLGLGKDFFKAGVRSFPDPAVAREFIAREARHHAAAEMHVVYKKLARQRAFVELGIEEQKRVLRIAVWEMQVQYFEGVARAVTGQRKTIKDAMKQTRDPDKLLQLNAELAQVEQIAEAVAVKPVAGRLPVNHRYAGKRVPDAELPPEFRGKGVRFNKEGFPEFEPHARTLPNGKKRVRIELTGSRPKDKQKANALFGWDKEPEGFRWHHHEKAGDMLLVPETLHLKLRHTGGAAIYKHVTGIKKYD